MIYRLAVEATGRRSAGGWAMLAALASPQFTVNAMSFYAMPGELALNLLFLWLLLKPGAKSAFAAGLVGGLALAMHNPVPHALMAAPALLWLAWDRQRWPRLAAALAGYVPVAAVLVLGWVSHLSGLEAAATRPGTPPAPQGLLGVLVFLVSKVLMLPTDDMLQARWYATWKIWIWGCPGLLLVLLVPRTRSTVERLLLAAFATTYVFFLFVRFDQGHGWGYRYIHTAWAALPVAAGIWLASAKEANRRWGAAMIAAGLLATPVFLWQTHRTIADTLAWRLSPPAAGEWVVFVNERTGRYRGDLVQNANLRTGLLHLVSRGDADDNALMARQFPGAVRVQRDGRGSLWRLPEGMLAEKLRATGAR
jgi:hypothetical protein